MYNGDEIHEHNNQRKLNILKGFVEISDIIEKAKNRQVGEVHSSGKYVWTQLANGKFDWRANKNEKQKVSPEGLTKEEHLQKINEHKQKGAGRAITPKMENEKLHHMKEEARHRKIIEEHFSDDKPKHNLKLDGTDNSDDVLAEHKKGNISSDHVRVHYAHKEINEKKAEAEIPKDGGRKVVSVHELKGQEGKELFIFYPNGQKSIINKDSHPKDYAKYAKFLKSNKK